MISILSGTGAQFSSFLPARSGGSTMYFNDRSSSRQWLQFKPSRRCTGGERLPDGCGTCLWTWGWLSKTNHRCLLSLPVQSIPFYLPGPASTSTPWLPTQHSAAALGRSCLPTKVLSLIQAGFLLSQCLTPQKSWLTCSHANPAPPQHTVWVLPYTWQSSVF